MLSNTTYAASVWYDEVLNEWMASFGSSIAKTTFADIESAWAWVNRCIALGGYQDV